MLNIDRKPQARTGNAKSVYDSTCTEFILNYFRPLSIISSSLEPDVVLCTVSVIPLPTNKLFCLHVFRQDGPPQRADYLASRWEIPLNVFAMDTATCLRIGSSSNSNRML